MIKVANIHDKSIKEFTREDFIKYFFISETQYVEGIIHSGSGSNYEEANVYDKDIVILDNSIEIACKYAQQLVKCDKLKMYTSQVVTCTLHFSNTTNDHPHWISELIVNDIKNYIKTNLPTAFKIDVEFDADGYVLNLCTMYNIKNNNGYRIIVVFCIDQNDLDMKSINKLNYVNDKDQLNLVVSHIEYYETNKCKF